MWVILLCVAVILLILAYVAITYADGNQNYWKNQGVYSIPNVFSRWQRFTIQVLPHENDTAIYNGLKAGNPHGKLGGILFLRHPTLFIMDPDLIRNVLVKDFDHFINRRVFDFKEPKMNLMLFNKINQDWKDLRNTMTPTFTTSKIRRMFRIFHTSALKMSQFIQTAAGDSGKCELDLSDVCGRFTMDVIASSAFGIDSHIFEDEKAEFGVKARKFLTNFTPLLLFRMMMHITFPKLAGLFKVSFFNEEAVTFLENVVRQSIQLRRHSAEFKRDDFLQIMLEAQANQYQPLESAPEADIIDDFEKNSTFKDSDNENIKSSLTDDVIIAQCNAFFFAGFDTVESLITYAAYELALNPELQDRLFDLLSRAQQGCGGELTYENVNQLEYLDMVISETLRKYPPVLRLERKCNEDYQIPGDSFVIKNGTHLAFPIYGIHYDPEHYPDPQKFDPERFSTEGKSKRHPYVYMPFGHGPRNCIAMRFALVEGKAAIAHLILNFRVSPCQKTAIPMKYKKSGMLKPENGMWLNLEKRI